MRIKHKTKRLVALLLSISMALLCMPMGVLAEETATPTDLPANEMAEETSGSELIPNDEPVPGSVEQEPADSSTESPSEDIEPEPEDDPRHPLEIALEAHGHIYVPTVHKTKVFSDARLKAETLVYTTMGDIFLMLATRYTKHATVQVWFLDEAGEVVSGYVKADDLDTDYLPDSDLEGINYLPSAEGMTDVGRVRLFVVNGSHPEAADEAQTDAPVMEPPAVSEVESLPDATEAPEVEAPAEDSPLVVEDEPQPEDAPTIPEDEIPSDNSEPSVEEEPTEAAPSDTEDEPQTEDAPTIPEDETQADTADIPGTEEDTPLGTEDEPQPEDTPASPEADTPTDSTEIPETDVPAYADSGDYSGVTTDTRVFAAVDDAASEDYLADEYLGNFVEEATVQVLSVAEDANGEVWYQVRFLYGDDFANGRMKWTDYATCWVMAAETCAAASDSCTVTDFAYPREIFRMLREMQMYATPMEGFTLKNISGSVGGFYTGQTGLYGSSGKDSAYPQLAKSASHGTIYATPHYLEDYTVYCLEHNLSGPGEGSGSSQTAKGPYTLVDMDNFVSNPGGGGVSGVRYSAKTMHALAWVLRHTYPFMVLNRSDANNEVWSRAAGQFAMREVIKQLEGAQYVRSYWDMDSFYAFSGGAPAVYLTYARWLAKNAIAHANITGNITVSNQSVSISGSNYIGSVTLTTDADLIRIPREVGTLTGNTGGSDSSYYYAKSGDTIQVTSTQSRFAITMESMPADDEESGFLVGIPSVSIQKVLVPVYGSPYPLKSASVTFELSYGEIRVTKQSADGLLLKDAVFELLNASGTVVATAATDSTGAVLFPSLQPGSYTVREKTAPQGYSLAASASQNVSVVAGVTTTICFVNECITGRIRIVKTDSITSRPLAGVVFSVTRMSGPASDNAADIGKVVATVTTNDQGVAETGLLPWGKYRITETGVPAGYLDEGYTYTVWIK